MATESKGIVDEYAEIPCVVLGGSPLQVLERDPTLVGASELSFLEKWASFLGSSPALGKYLLNGGVSWVDIPIGVGPNASRRLFLCPYVVVNDSRPTWTFKGLFLKEADYAHFGEYDHFLDASIATLSGSRCEQSGLVRIRLRLDRRSWKSLGTPRLVDAASSESRAGFRWFEKMFRTPYPKDALFQTLGMACNPSDEYAEFSIILLSDDSPLPGLRLISQTNDEPPSVEIDTAQRSKSVMSMGTLFVAAIEFAIVVAIVVGAFPNCAQ